jgi:hypothetical protein
MTNRRHRAPLYGRGEKKPSPDAASKALDLITAPFTRLAGLVAIAVGLNASVTTCTNDDLQRNETFQKSVQAEETYWRDLYDEYLDAVGEKGSGGATPGVVKTEKLKIIYFIAGARQNPDFKQYRLGFWRNEDTQKADEKKYLDQMRDNLRNLITQYGKSGRVLAPVIDVKTSSTEIRPRNGENVIAPPSTENPSGAPLQATATLNYDAQVLSTAPIGIDLDVFWCIGENEDAYYGIARQAALYFAEYANAKKKILTHDIGRVRLRPMLEDRQTTDKPHGLEFAPGNADEQWIAERLAGSLEAATTLKFTMRPITSNPQAKFDFYMSMSVCKALEAPPGTP